MKDFNEDEWLQGDDIPTPPSNGFSKLFFKTDGKLYSINSSSLELRIGPIDTGSFIISSSFNSFTQSYYIDSSSFDYKIISNANNISAKVSTGSFNVFTQSYYQDSASFNNRLNNISIVGYVMTGSFNAFTQSYYNDSQSFNNRINNITGSSQINTGSFVLTSSFNAFTQSYYQNSASFDIRINQKLNSGSFNAFTQSYYQNSASFNSRINNIIFGTEYHYDELNIIGSTTSTSYITCLKLTTGALPAGNYRVQAYAEVSPSNANRQIDVEVRLDQTDGTPPTNGTVLSETSTRPSAASVYANISMLKSNISLTAGIHTIALNYKISSNTATIRNVRIELFRIS